MASCRRSASLAFRASRVSLSRSVGDSFDIYPNVKRAKWFLCGPYPASLLGCGVGDRYGSHVAANRSLEDQLPIPCCDHARQVGDDLDLAGNMPLTKRNVPLSIREMAPHHM